MEELNISHTIISRAALVGLERAVREMKQAMRGVLSLAFAGYRLTTDHWLLIKMQTYYYVLASQSFLIEEEPLEEFWERTRHYHEREKKLILVGQATCLPGSTWNGRG